MRIMPQVGEYVRGNSRAKVLEVTEKFVVYEEQDGGIQVIRSEEFEDCFDLIVGPLSAKQIDAIAHELREVKRGYSVEYGVNQIIDIVQGGPWEGEQRWMDNEEVK